MIKNAIKKIAGLVLILIIISFFVFLLMYIAPGDPAEKRLTSQGVVVTKEILDSERERLGLLKPFFVRYGEWLIAVLQGDFGVSFKDDLPVAPKLWNALIKTVILSSTSLALSLIVSLPLALWSALKQNKLADYVIRLFTFIGNSLPNFLISVLLMYLFCIKLSLFSVIATGDLKGLIMPVLSLSIPMTARFIRQMRTDFLRELDEDYIIGMYGRGVKHRYIVFNIVRNTIGNIFVIIALQIGSLMGGSVVIETIFRWPGIGNLVMESIDARDYPVIMGFVLIMGTIYVVINQISDILCRVMDPRSAYEKD